MSIKCKGNLIFNTGICPGNYMYWASKSECDNWFSNKSKGNFDNYSVIKPDPRSRNAFNVACVHVDMPYSKLTECDYVSINNEGFGRWIHCQIVDREYVNEKSTRLYFSIDYVASFYDTIKLGRCLVQRTHVTDDWDGMVSKSKYLLPEPLPVNVYSRPELMSGLGVFDGINQWLDIDGSFYTLISSVKDDGTVNDPKMNFQAGAPVNGYMYNGTPAEIEEMCKKYITYSSKIINKSSSIMENVTNIYCSYIQVAENRDNKPILHPGGTVITFVGDILHPTGFKFPKHAKVLDYFRVRIVGNSGDYIWSLANIGNELWFKAYFTGGPNGNCTILFYNKEGKYAQNRISSNSWPAVSIAGAIERNNFSFNNPLSSEDKTPPVGNMKRGGLAF